MKNHRPQLIGTTELWSARLGFDTPRNAAELQNTVTEYVAESGITVVGYYTNSPPALTLLRWPETRPGYSSPEIEDCNVALNALAMRLRAQSQEGGVVPVGKIHTMMGRKRGGYGEGVVASMHNLRRDDLDDYSVTEAYMISARTVAGQKVEPYGEPVGIIVTSPANEDAIHQLGYELEQHHYAIERSPEKRTDFWETRWSPTYVPNEPDA